MPPVRSMKNNNLNKHLLAPHRLRRVPSQFSWVDHRLVRQNHLPRAAAAAWACIWSWCPSATNAT